MLFRDAPARLSAGVLLASVAVVQSGTALAQAPAAAPPIAVPPAALQQAAPNRDQVDQPRPDAIPAPAQVQVDSAGAVTAVPCPLDRYDVKTTIRTIRFTGLGDAPLAPELLPLLADISGAPPAGEQPVRVICDIRDRANAALRRAGYVASVQIPPQKIESGELTLTVISAHIVDVRVRGDAGPYRDTLAARIEKLKALDPLNEKDAERILLIANEVPGLRVQLSLRPAGTKPGDVIGELAVSYARFALLANVQNYGSRQLGRETGYARADVFGLTGNSVTYVAGSSTLDFSEQQVVQTGHLQGIGGNGTTLGGSFIYAWSKPDLGQLDLTSRSLISGIELAHPLIRTTEGSLRVAAGFEIIEQRTRVGLAAGGTTPLNRDKLRIAYLRLDSVYRQPGSWGGDRFVLSGRVEVRQGLDILRATKRGEFKGGFSPSRPQGDPTATVVKADVDAIVGLGPIFSLYGAARAQYANNPLLNFEEFSLGNLTIGRGYDPGANSADRAIGLRGEVRAKVYDPPQGPRVDVYGFYDSVRIYNLDSGSTETRRSLDSYGAGLRALLANRLQFEATYAHPRDRALLIPGAKRSSDRALLSLTYQFRPGVQ